MPDTGEPAVALQYQNPLAEPEAWQPLPVSSSGGRERHGSGQIRESLDLMLDGGSEPAGVAQERFEHRVALEVAEMEEADITRRASLSSRRISKRSLQSLDEGGANVGEVRIGMPGAKNTDHSRAGSTSSHSDPHHQDPRHADLLEQVPLSQQVEVVFENISAWVPLAFKPPGLAKKLKDKVVKPTDAAVAKSRKQILFSISASCMPGELLALMGPSGSGKTSLLSVLGDRKPPAMTQTGAVRFNGNPMSRSIKRRIGFVLQDDLLHETLTVQETLKYIAILRLPKTMSMQEKESRAEGVMEVLGITKQRDTLVGGRMQRGISGGERKRVSVGAELLINPSVILLDEPTSGLDASTALHLVETLRQLASGGRTIITTIHQPSSRLFATMDSLILLSQGHPMYIGKANLADAWFAHLGYQNPGGFNIADYVLDLASNTVPLPDAFANRIKEASESGHQPSSARSSGEGTDEEWDTIRYLQHAAANFLSKHSRGFVRREQLAEVPPPQQAQVRRAFDSALLDVPLDDKDAREEKHDTEVAKTPPYGASWVTQFRILTERSIKTRRLDSLNIEKLLQVVLIGLLAGMFWFQSGQKRNLLKYRDFVGVLFFIIIFPTFGAVFAALFTFPMEFMMLKKERSSSMYRLSAYYLARSCADLPLIIIMPSVFFNIVYWMTGFQYTAAKYFFTWFVMCLMVLTGDSSGAWIGALAMDARRAQTFVTVFMLGQFLVAGFFVRNIPSWISWSKYLSFIYWGYSLVNKIQLKGVSITYCPANDVDGSVCPPGTEQILSGASLAAKLKPPRSLSESPVLDVFVLIAFLLFFRMFTYVVLKRRTNS